MALERKRQSGRLSSVNGSTLDEIPLRVHRFLITEDVVGCSRNPDGCRYTDSNLHLEDSAGCRAHSFGLLPRKEKIRKSTLVEVDY